MIFSGRYSGGRYVEPWVSETKQYQFVSALAVAVLGAVVWLLLWGWFALTLAPVQRYYLWPYAKTSLHVKLFDESVGVTWILKTGPQARRRIALPEDLYPEAATGDVPPFQLSARARAEGWTGIDWSVPVQAASPSLRDFLRDGFFEGQSFWLVFLTPFELAFAVFCLRRSCVLQRERRSRIQAAGDLSLPLSPLRYLLTVGERVFAQPRAAIFIVRRWIKGGRRSWKERAAGLRTRAAAASSESSPPSSTEAVPMVLSKPQPPALPFGLSRPPGQPAREWDLSQWID